MTPVFVAAQEAVHEDQGRRAAPLANEVQFGARLRLVRGDELRRGGKGS